MNDKREAPHLDDELSSLTIEQLSQRTTIVLQSRDIAGMKVIIDYLFTTNHLARFNEPMYESYNQLLYQMIHTIMVCYRNNKTPECLTDFLFIDTLFYYASHRQLAQLFSRIEPYATKEDQRAMETLLTLLWQSLIEEKNEQGHRQSLPLLEQLLNSHFANARQQALDKRYLANIETLLNNESILLQNRVRLVIALFGYAEKTHNKSVEKIVGQFALLIRRAILSLLFTENSDEISGNTQRVAQVIKLFASLTEIEQRNLAVDMAFIIENKRDHTIINNLSRLFPQLLQQLLLNRYLTNRANLQPLLRGIEQEALMMQLYAIILAGEQRDRSEQLINILKHDREITAPWLESVESPTQVALSLDNLVAALAYIVNYCKFTCQQYSDSYLAIFFMLFQHYQRQQGDDKALLLDRLYKKLIALPGDHDKKVANFARFISACSHYQTEASALHSEKFIALLEESRLSRP